MAILRLSTRESLSYAQDDSSTGELPIIEESLRRGESSRRAKSPRKGESPITGEYSVPISDECWSEWEISILSDSKWLPLLLPIKILRPSDGDTTDIPSVCSSCIRVLYWRCLDYMDQLMLTQTYCQGLGLCQFAFKVVASFSSDVVMHDSSRPVLNIAVSGWAFEWTVGVPEDGD